MDSKKIEQSYNNKSITFSSDTISKEGFRQLSCQVNLSNESGFSGQSTIEVSNDLETWFELPESATALTDSNFYDITTGAVYIRATITISAGSGDINLDWLMA